MLKKISAILIFSSISCYATNSNNLNTNQLIAVMQASNKNDIQTLSNLSQAYPQNELISYLNAKANLNKSSTLIANSFIKNYTSGYFHDTLSHQLLNYYFTNQDWDNYIRIYNQLDSNQISQNETCGLDLANLAKNNSQKPHSDINYLLANKMPLWCVSLVASQINSKQLSSNEQNQFLDNLIANNQITQFNQIAPAFGIKPQNFSTNIINSQNLTSYQMIYQIKNLSLKYPVQAFNSLSKNTVLSNSDKEFLFNQIAPNLATHQMFDLAKQAINSGSKRWISDDQYEWRVRTYLYFSDWKSVVDTIKSMPESLQNKNTWLYWHAYADSKLKHKTTAQKLLEKIPANYSYYSLLAQADLNTPLNAKFTIKNIEIKDTLYSNQIQQAFDLYQSAKQINNSTFTGIANQNLHYIINQSPDEDKAAISRYAFSIGWNELGIYAATKMDIPDASLSFPLLFTTQYQQSAQQFGIESSYAMAISRQESRFNPNALAFDGGVGLMQIMPATASYIARKIGSPNCYKNYSCNIQFGSWFLSHLLKKFGNNIIYASAGYNAGPGRAHNWQQSFQNLDNRIQIELIPFKITRDYVQKVSTNKLIYDNLMKNSQINMIDFLNQVSNKNTTYIIDDDNTNGDASGNQIADQT